MAFLESAHASLAVLVNYFKMALEFISVFCVFLGLASSLRLAGGFFKGTGPFLQTLPAVRLQFGSWLALALEFQLGADIVASTVKPSLQALIELGLLALIRTFLNYFLQKELAEQEQAVKERQGELLLGKGQPAGQGAEAGKRD